FIVFDTAAGHWTTQSDVRWRLAGHPSHASLTRRHEEDTPDGIERWRHEIGGAPLIRQTVLARANVIEDYRPAVGSDFPRPLRASERLGKQQLPVLSIQHIEEAVAVGKHHHLARLTRDGEVAEHRYLCGVPIVHVVRRELVVPLEHASVDIQSH